MPGDAWQQFANLRLLYAMQWFQPGKKLLFMGGDFGQWIEWNFRHSLDWHLLDYESHQGIMRLISDLNRLYLDEGTLQMRGLGRGMAWLDTGTHESLHEAASFIQTIEKRQGLRVACPEEIAFRQGWIDREQLKQCGQALSKTAYGQYLLGLAQ